MSIGYLTIGLDRKGYQYASLDIVVLGFLGIFDVLAQERQHCHRSTGEFGHLVYFGLFLCIYAYTAQKQHYQSCCKHKTDLSHNYWF